MTRLQDPTYKPQLRHCTFFAPDTGGPMLMIVGDQHFEIEQHGSDLESFLNLKRYFDGRHTIADMARITGVAEDDARAIVASFEEQGLLRDADATIGNIPADVFVKQIGVSTGMWSEQIGYHRLWSGLENQDFRREVLLGLVIETYHYINSASRHIGTAIAHCSDPDWQHLLSAYLADEYDHARLARESLVRMGLPEEQVLGAHPLIGTWSLVNNLCEIARNDTLGYLACTKLFEARGAESLEGGQTLRRLAAAYGYPEDCLDPLVSHVEADVVADHTGLLEQALAGRDAIEVARAHTAVNNLHDLKHSYDQYSDNIIYYYSDVSNYIPRLKVDYFSL